MYLLTSTMIFGLPVLSAWYEQTVHSRLSPYLYGMAHVGRVGSVYLTMSVTIER